MRIRTLVTAAGIAAVAAVPALAADRTATLSASAPSYDWAGGPGDGVAVTTPVTTLSARNTIGCHDTLSQCEETLLKVEVAGTLTITANADDDSTDAIDLYLWPSNEAGEYDDEEEDLASGDGATEASDEKISLPVEPGWYMARVDFFDAQDDTYKASAVLSGFPPPVTSQPTGPQPPVQQPPQPPAQQPQQSQNAEPAPRKPSAAERRRACEKKAKKKFKKNNKKRKAALKRCRKIR